MKTIVFRTAGGRGIGYGHYYRSYSLARFLVRTYNVNVIFIINKDLEETLSDSEFDYLISASFDDDDISLIASVSPNLFVLDSYLANNDYLIQVKSFTNVMLFDDNNDLYDSTIPDIILNGNIHAEELLYKRNPNSLYLLGPRYLVMREEYWSSSCNVDSDGKRGLMITTGGTDPYEISYQILNHLKEAPFLKKVIIGPGYGNNLINKLETMRDNNIELIYMPASLKEHINESKVVITAGGSTVYEVITQQTIPVIFSMADNQDIACSYFAKLGLHYLGKFPQMEFHQIFNSICNLIQDGKNELCAYSGLVDGQGVRRVLQNIQPYIT